METINVAVGIICRRINDTHQFLISYRHPHLHQGGLWEFPGGKIEQGEGLKEALTRELNEELGIKVIQQQPIFEINHNYPDKKVCLQICLVNDFTGKEKGLEKQQIKWVSKEKLAEHNFPEANKPIIDYILKNL